MGLPIVQEIFDGIRFIINFVMDKAPRPIQILIFLLMILIFGNLLSYFMHFGGIHCDTHKNPVKVDTLDIVTNVRVWWEIETGTLNQPNISIEKANPFITDLITAFNDCYYILRNNSGTIEFCDFTNLTGCNYYYRESECVNCTSVDLGRVHNEDFFLNFKYINNVCSDDAYYNPDKSWFTRNMRCDSSCRVPEHYYFDFEQGILYCADLDYCGVNATLTPDTQLDQLLKEAQAELIYTSPNTYSYTDIIRVSCSTNLHPRLKIFGKLDMFDYKLWIGIFVIVIMFTFLHKIL